MSVDTYLKGKTIAGRYRRFDTGGVQILVANTLVGWAEDVTLDAPRFLLRRRLKPTVRHQHHPT